MMCVGDGRTGSVHKLKYTRLLGHLVLVHVLKGRQMPVIHAVEENIVEQGVFWDVVVQLQTFDDHRVGQVFPEVKQAT